MNHPILFAALLAGRMLGLAGPRSAQFFPGYGYGGWGGTNGSAALLGSDYRQATAMQLKAQSMQAGQQAAMAAKLRRAKRHSQHPVQPGPEPDQCDPEPATGEPGLVVPAAAAANGPAQGHGVCIGAPAVPVGFAPSGGPPPAAMDIIKWPTVLQESCFASERTKIEAPVSPHPAQAEYSHGGRLSPDGQHRRGHEGRAGVAAEGRHQYRRLQRGQDLPEPSWARKSPTRPKRAVKLSMFETL